MKAIAYILMSFFIIGMVSAISMVREGPSTVTQGETFTIRYLVIDGSGNYGVLIEDDVTSGCTVGSTTDTHVATGFLSPSTFMDIEYTAPATTGTCTFIGNYQFSGAGGTQAETNFQNLEVAIGEAPECTSNSECSSYSNGCKVGSCTGGQCISTNKPEGTVCSGGSCQGGFCKTTPSDDKETDNTTLYIILGGAAFLLVAMGGRRR